MTQTPHLALPLLAAAQAQKHVTHNEALLALDALAQLAVASRSLATPPVSPAEGLRHIIPAAATGAWSGRTGQIALFSAGGWLFLAPEEGWRAWLADEKRLIVFSGVWKDAVATNPAPMLGVNTSADATNRLAVKSDAALFSHDDVTPGSGDMRIVLNKSASAGTASLTWQTGYSGRAEIGTAGSDDLAVKVSANGASWAVAARFTAGGETLMKQAVIEGAAGTARPIEFRSGSSPRWRLSAGAEAEGGGNAGSRFLLGAYSDAGALLGTPIAVTRATLAVELPSATFDANAVAFAKSPLPATDNATTLGSAAKRWSVVYAATGVINTSDAAQKAEIADCPLGLDFVKALTPRSYRWRDGARRHLGFIAQEVKAALDAAGVDCGLWVSDDPSRPEAAQSLRYDQLIAPLARAIRELDARLATLEAAR